MAKRMEDRSVLVFGRGPVGDHVAQRLRDGRVRVEDAASVAPSRALDGAVVSLETSPQTLALAVFEVVECLHTDRRKFPGPPRRIVVVVPAGDGEPGRVGRSVARTLKLYIGAPDDQHFHVVHTPARPCADAVEEAADLVLTLLLDPSTLRRTAGTPLILSRSELADDPRTTVVPRRLEPP